MRLFVCLFGLAAAGTAQVALPNLLLTEGPMPTSGVAALWTMSLGAFGVPLSLMVLLATRRNLIRLACVVWGIWVTALSIPILLNPSRYFPSLTANGTLLAAFVLVMSLGMILFGIMALMRRKAVQK